MHYIFHFQICGWSKSKAEITKKIFSLKQTFPKHCIAYNVKLSHLDLPVLYLIFISKCSLTLLF